MTASLVPVTDQRGRVGPGQVVVDQLALLGTHRGAPPQLLLRWGAMPAHATVDVVVHLHGHSRRGRAMHLVRDIAPVSGLDLADPSRPSTAGRTRPTLLVLPRGHFYGGRSGRGYSFPALERPGAITKLVDEALRRFSAASGVRATRGRLILTAHSGGGASLMAILRHLDPDEVHTFDALYGDPGPLIAWARKRQTSGSGALRVLFRPGEPTARNSLRVATALGTGSARFRVEQTGVSHMAIPQTYGWRLLADAGADLPGATRPGQLATMPDNRPPADSPLCTAIARVARDEFRRWRPGGGAALTETSAAASPILREYYRVGVGVTVTDAQMRSTAYQAGHPWSAVFISYVMRTAGAGSAFRYSAAHQTYISDSRKSRLAGDTSKPFWAYRATELAPRIGDLVCASRSNSGATYDNISDPQTRATHCDVVTEIQPGRIRVIGGNVSQTVGEKWLRTLPDGKLNLTGSQSLFFAVIRCRSAQTAPAPAPGPTYGPPAPGPTYGPPAPVPATLDGRIVRVMDLLVNQYGYPVQGAAGIVGNLIAESPLLPNSIEGSNRATPMRAVDFNGRLRTFTPDEVRTRSETRKIGPRNPGIGIAQWSFRTRRAGLFRHVYRGRRLGSAILNDLDAQVDYLVTELRGSHRRAGVVVRSPGVTLEQASDAMLLHFEKPKRVLHLPVDNPVVRAVMRERRGYSRRALRIYRALRPA